MVDAPRSFEDLLLGAAEVLLITAAGWASVVLLAVVGEALTGGRLRVVRALGCPPRWHRWLLAVVTALLAGSFLAPPAGAEADRPQRRGIDGLALPDRPTTPDQKPRAREPPPVSAWVEVLPGDSLWEISRRALPAGSSPGSIADLTRRLHAHNRSTVGADPDLIHPGQRLRVPPVPRETYSEDS